MSEESCMELTAATPRRKLTECCHAFHKGKISKSRGTVKTADNSRLPDIYKLVGQTDINKICFMPKSCVNYRKPRKISDGRGDRQDRELEI